MSTKEAKEAFCQHFDPYLNKKNIPSDKLTFDRPKKACHERMGFSSCQRDTNIFFLYSDNAIIHDNTTFATANKSEPP